MNPFPADTAGSILHNIQHNDRFQKRNNQWAYPTPAMYTTQVAGRCERSAPARPLKIWMKESDGPRSAHDTFRTIARKAIGK